jgi:hypothetical protein
MRCSMSSRTQNQDRASRNALVLSAIICLECITLSWAWTPAISALSSNVGSRSNLLSCARKNKCALKSIRMSGIPPPPPQQPSSSNIKRNSMRKPPPPPPTRAIEDIENNLSTGKSKVRKERNAQEGTFSNPIEGAVYQDEKGYDVLCFGYSCDVLIFKPTATCGK